MNRSLGAAALAGVALVLVGCGSKSGPTAADVQVESTSLAAAQTSPTTSADQGSTVTAVDPCQKLSKADVQPFFTVPIVIEVPEPWNTATTKACSFSSAGTLATTLSVKITAGEDAQTMALLNQGSTDHTTFGGVGTSAWHLKGSTEMTALEGTSSNPVFCSISTTGWKELAGKKDLADVTNIPDAAATTIAEQYGTLCNKIFGNGTSSATMTVAAPATGGSAATTAPSGSVLPVGSTLAGLLPLPEGMDCSGSKTTVDSEGTTCVTTFADASAAYNFFLAQLPAKGMTIDKIEPPKAGSTVVGITFSGGGTGMFDSLSIVNGVVRISLQKQ
ncbi:hypothetical protein SAMN04515671_1567 [Nakamurella panacisegetis]|uniref:Uncharacterized protein n=1 Tax=Nakamurella panacisegetis TaxID=1090615 RepID=A0A1H0L8Q7_9ACTN|nr:hypothetical protein [Nakamurella panacisegetis]SDO64383.1 hypothetical protein SAMN04515671_1567 [Nakamurella panacisegetis]